MKSQNVSDEKPRLVFVSYIKYPHHEPQLLGI